MTAISAGDAQPPDSDRNLDAPIVEHSKHLFRRQFLFGPNKFSPNSAWRTQTISPGMELSHHNDLDVAIRKEGERTLALIGTAIDPYSPLLSLEELLGKSTMPSNVSPEYLVATTERWTGRWCFICSDGKRTLMISDPCGLRQVHFCIRDGVVWCGSQPEILRTQIELTPNESVIKFVELNTSAYPDWVMTGKRTIYNDCFALLPNHRLDLGTGKSERFFPLEPIRKIAPKDALPIAIQCLQGGLEGILHRGPVAMAVTAGYDSRVLLAASRPFRNDYDYFVDRKGQLAMTDPDVAIPSRICEKIGQPFAVENSDKMPDEKFLAFQRKQVTGARSGAKQKMIFRKFQNEDQRTNINGNGSEICRFYFDPYLVRARTQYTAEKLAKRLLMRDPEFLHDEIGEWIDDAQDAISKGYLCLDLAYWEIRMGRWGALYPAEQDIAVDEFSPFNNRFFIRTMLGLPYKSRCAPKFKFYRQIIKELWPEVLNEPFNPEPFKQALRHWAYQRIPDDIQEILVVGKRILKSALRR